jgi:hypothetical protein
MTIGVALHARPPRQSFSSRRGCPIRWLLFQNFWSPICNLHASLGQFCASKGAAMSTSPGLQPTPP